MVLATFSAAGSQGWVWLWCEPMAEARLHCCCPEDPDADETASVARPCCEPRVGEGLPVLTTDERRDASPTLVLAPAPAHGWLAPSVEFLPRASISAAPRGSSARAGPRVRLHALVSVYLV